MAISSIIQSLKTVLLEKGNNENAIQSTLEEFSELIPLPFLLNHHLHLDIVFKKFLLPDGRRTDFLYLTKSTVKWWVVLIEIESSNKRIFTKSSNPEFHNQFNKAFDQITIWKAYMEKEKNKMKASILPYLDHMHNNAIEFKYVLIIGRSSELLTQQQKDLFAQKDNENIRVMTYDSLLHQVTKNAGSKVIANNTTNGLEIVRLNDTDTGVFSVLPRGNIFFDKKIRAELLKKGYNLKAWEDGNLLILNNKEPKSKFLSELSKLD